MWINVSYGIYLHTVGAGLSLRILVIVKYIDEQTEDSDQNERISRIFWAISRHIWYKAFLTRQSLCDFFLDISAEAAVFFMSCFFSTIKQTNEI